MASRFGSLQQFIRRHRRIIQAVFFPIAAVSAFFYLFVLTAMVALDVLKYPSWFVAFGVFLYVQMWMIATDSAMDAVSELYGIKLLPWWRREFVPILPKRAQPRSHAVAAPSLAISSSRTQ